MTSNETTTDPQPLRSLEEAIQHIVTHDKELLDRLRDGDSQS